MTLVTARWTELEADQRVWLTDVSWEGFESFLALRGEKGPRVTYLNGTLELMSPSRDHERIGRRISAVLQAYLDHVGIRYESLGAWLLKNAPNEAGLEPDDCYLLHAASKSRPDIAVEVVWTSGGLEKLTVYERLGVPEVWIWMKGTLRYFVLFDGGYAEHARSSMLPDFDASIVAEMLQLEMLSDDRRALRERFG
jgi:Uma2 family endonuclease